MREWLALVTIVAYQTLIELARDMISLFFQDYIIQHKTFIVSLVRLRYL